MLDRYFHNPGRYEVGDGVVRCDPHWVLRMDDDHRERVVVFLGDLGRDLPYTEQLHWRAHNILPDGGLSVTARTRSFDAQFADGVQPEHRFKIAYRHFCGRWLDVHGWPLFRPLATGDEHLLTKLHVPTSDNPAELDAQYWALPRFSSIASTMAHLTPFWGRARRVSAAWRSFSVFWMRMPIPILRAILRPYERFSRCARPVRHMGVGRVIPRR